MNFNTFKSHSRHSNQCNAAKIRAVIIIKLKIKRFFFNFYFIMVKTFTDNIIYLETTRK